MPVTLVAGALACAAELAAADTKIDEPRPLPALTDPAPAASLRTLLSRDLAAAKTLVEGSPVALRAAARSAVRPAVSRTAVEEQRVFRDTQHGPFDTAIADAAEYYRLDPFLLKGLLQNESGLDATLVGRRIYKKVGGQRRMVGGGARGIAQFTTDGVDAVNEVRHARRLRGETVEPFTDDDVMNPDRAIPAAAELLASFVERFGRDGGITAYNTGPHGGRLVAREGFYRARRSGQLSSVGTTQLQGHRFLLNVLRRTNQFRRAAGLAPLRGPGDDRTPVEKGIDRVLHDRTARRKLPNS